MTDPNDILNWRRLSPTVTTSGQPSEAQLAQIQALGVKHVINLGLHTHERALADEAATATGLGMRYVHIPVDFEAPTADDFDRFCAALQATGDEPVHVHCILNARVSAFFYRYRREVLGQDPRAARAALESVWRPAAFGPALSATWRRRDHRTNMRGGTISRDRDAGRP